MSALDRLSLLVRSQVGALRRDAGSPTRAVSYSEVEAAEAAYQHTLDAIARLERLVDAATARAPERVARARNELARLQRRADEERALRDTRFQAWSLSLQGAAGAAGQGGGDLGAGAASFGTAAPAASATAPTAAPDAFDDPLAHPHDREFEALQRAADDEARLDRLRATMAQTHTADDALSRLRASMNPR